MSYEIKANGRACYIGLDEDLCRDQAEALEKLVEEVELSESVIKIFIFDISKLQKIAESCIRPFVLAMSKARKREDSLVLVIQPNYKTIRDQLLEKGAIRPDELCQRASDVPVLLKRRGFAS